MESHNLCDQQARLYHAPQRSCTIRQRPESRLHGVGDGAQLQAPVTQRGQYLQRARARLARQAPRFSLARPEKASLFGIAALVFEVLPQRFRAAYRS